MCMEVIEMLKFIVEETQKEEKVAHQDEQKSQASCFGCCLRRPTPIIVISFFRSKIPSAKLLSSGGRPYIQILPFNRNRAPNDLGGGRRVHQQYR